jgi:hypothetical protein
LSLSEDLEQEALTLKAITVGCKTCEWLQTLEDREHVTEKIDRWYQDGLPHVNLWRILRRNGYPASEVSLRRHRENCLLLRQSHVN